MGQTLGALKPSFGLSAKNPETSMMSKSQEETEVSWHLEKLSLEAGVQR